MSSAAKSDRVVLWRNLIGQRLSSRLTVRQLCVQAGVSPASYFQWQQRLEAADQAAPSEITRRSCRYASSRTASRDHHGTVPSGPCLTGDGLIEFDTGLSERSLRTLALRRKTYVFFGSPGHALLRGAERETVPTRCNRLPHRRLAPPRRAAADRRVRWTQTAAWSRGTYSSRAHAAARAARYNRGLIRQGISQRR